MVAQAADEYLDQVERGETPDLDAFARRYPQIAGVLPQILPTLGLIQGLEPVADGRDPLPPGTSRLGEFRLVREIGRGGMGIVYEAEETTTGRRVALKVLREQAALGGRPLARFQIEAQVAALLDHPHIVPILAVGCDEGVYYHALRLVEGASLAELLGELRSRSQARRAALSPRQAAWLALHVAQALEHAHAMGILHRDIKPANLLLEGDGHVWVTDFGLAHLQGVSDLTLSGDMPGTLRYMSPEQAAGQKILDPRTDVYSLGATLYEVLTTVPAFDAADRQALLRQIAAGNPPPPTRLAPEVPRALEAIVLKAMAVDPDLRYPSAGALADDLARFLDGRPILARRPGPIARLARWARRHQRLVAAGGTMLVLLVVCLAGGLAALWNAQRHTRAALQAARNAQAREREALRFTFAASDQVTSRALSLVASPGSALGPEDRQFCRVALAYYQQLADRYRDDPEMRRIAAAADHRIGFIRMILEEPAAEEAYRRSLAAYDALRAEPSAGPDLRLEQVVALVDLGILHRRTGRLADAAECLRRVVEIQRSLVREFPAGSLYLRSLLNHQEGLLTLLEQIGQPDAIDAARRELRDGYTLAIDREPENARYRNNLAWLLAGRPIDDPDDRGRAVALAREAVEIEPGMGVFWNTLGAALYRAGDWDGSAQALERSMQLRAGGDPFDWFFLAMACRRRGQAEAARRWFDRATTWRKAHAHEGPNPALDRFEAEARAALGMPPP
jgi:tetratricopeptide (TPR) repeat protein